MPRIRKLFGIGLPPFRFLAERLLREDEFLADLRRVTSLSDPQFSSLAKALKDYPHFLDAAQLKKIVAREVLGKEAEPLAATLLQLNRLMGESADSSEEALAALRSELEDHKDSFSESSADELLRRLRELLLAPRGLSRQKKAETLAESTGAELSDIRVICDMRPVFDEERKAIEGAVAVTTLRLEIVEPDGTLGAVECHLTEQQLDRLCKVSDGARRKLAAIKDLLRVKDIPRATLSDEMGA